MHDQLSAIEKRSIADGYCPDCGHRGFVLGPRGGLMLNIECGNVGCRARFNVLLNYFDRAMVFAHRIEHERDGGSNWGKVIRQ